MSDEGVRDLRLGSRASRKRSPLGAALRSVALALLGSLLFGFAVGLWLRCRMEAPEPPYLGAAPSEPPSRAVTHTRVAR